MRLEHLVTAAVGHLFGRLLRHTLLLSVIVALAVIALYHATIAGTVALELHFSVLQARLIVAGIYAALTLIATFTLWLMRRPSAAAGTPTLSAQREMQMAMLVEAVMIGYSLARKGERTP